MGNYVQNIIDSKLTIYDYIEPNRADLYIPTEILQQILAKELVGVSLNGYALRTRSKIVKSKICTALGYPIPSKFQKTQPRFIGQNFDVYTQKSLNVQIWNEEIDAQRRYVFLRVDSEDIIVSVKVITGDTLVQYDRTGTLTRKYQATMNPYGRNICSEKDTPNIENWLSNPKQDLTTINPNSLPRKDQLLSISEVYKRLLPIVGMSINYLDAVQERNRGAELHALICQHLGYSTYTDDGTYPDIANQLLEIKLQTSPTIDLGLHSPEDGKLIFAGDGTNFYSSDVRYAILDGVVNENRILLRNLYLVTGEDFSRYFPLFKGKGINAKIQIPLPYRFFD